MQRSQGTIALSATDLSSFFECEHRTVLDLAVLERELQRPGKNDLERRMLERRGLAHEARTLHFYEAQGLRVARIPELVASRSDLDAGSATIAEMESGADVIYQGQLRHEGWLGRPDFLLRTPTPAGSESRFGPHMYEPVDAKLAREEKARAVLQLCSYAHQLLGVQGVLPSRIWLALGSQEIAPLPLNTADYAAYFERARRRLETFVASPPSQQPYPEPVEYCEVCDWWKRCEDRRRADDHLSLVAGITRRQRARLEHTDVTELVQLARLPKQVEVKGIESGALERIRTQARLQHEGRSSGKALHELVTDFGPGSGLELLPNFKPGDLFLDLEGDAFVGTDGLEYLFGLLELGEPVSDWSVRDRPGAPRYRAFWAKNRLEEKAAFEAIIDRIKLGRDEFQDLHVFHFGHRESDALKKLACRHATREDDVDTFLRAGVLVDLHTVVRQALRASVEAYTLKELEALHGFKRAVARRDAARAMQLFGWWLETQEAADDLAEVQKTIEEYNKEDCLSTLRLRDWLEQLRLELAAQIGRPLARPVVEPDAPKELDERSAESERVAASLRAGLPADPVDDAPEQAAKRLLADLLGWHWREMKSSCWEYHTARKLPPSEWLESRFVMAELSYLKVVAEVKQSLVHRYTFPEQEHAVRTFPDPELAGLERKKVKVVAIGPNYVDIKRGKASKEGHPAALRPGWPMASTDQAKQLLEIAKSIAQHGFAGEPYRAAKDLLLRSPPRCGLEPGAPLVAAGEDTVLATERLCCSLDRSVLSIQGPPGSGKTYRATQAILKLIAAGKKVGVTANSHQVIAGLLRKVQDAASAAGTRVSIQHFVDPERYEGQQLPFQVANDTADAAQRLATGALQLMGGTTFAWAKEALRGSVDVLFVEEAGQLSLANVLAVSPAAHSLVLLGDPAQLEQPRKGTHPPGAEVSCLEHVLGEAVTMPPELGVFLPETRRLHPEICAFTSRIFYEDRLQPMAGLAEQRIDGPGRLSGSGLRYAPVEHEGNTNRSDEEVLRVAAIVSALFASKATFRDSRGVERELRVVESELPGAGRERDVLVVAPYNAQVAALKSQLPQDRVLVGTVDKIQGMQAPIVIYSMTTSSGEEAPRGLEFLYSLNRFNVATSRAQALVVLVASPALVRVKCRTPRQLKLVNALCEYLQRAELVTL